MWFHTVVYCMQSDRVTQAGAQITLLTANSLSIGIGGYQGTAYLLLQ
jgi:hypothetical protein